jgi:integral membrane protein
MLNLANHRRLFKTLYSLAFVDGVALLALVFVAVPLKRMLDLPVFVSILGPTHGVLFLSLIATVIYALIKRALPGVLALKIVVLAFVPLGGFYADHLIKKHSQQHGLKNAGPQGL